MVSLLRMGDIAVCGKRVASCGKGDPKLLLWFAFWFHTAKLREQRSTEVISHREGAGKGDRKIALVRSLWERRTTDFKVSVSILFLLNFVYRAWQIEWGGHLKSERSVNRSLRAHASVKPNMIHQPTRVGVRNT